LVIPQNADPKVFKWLGADERGVGRYLHWLNLCLGPNEEMDLSCLRSTAGRLEAEPSYWSEVIRDRNWRYTLVGCACLLISHQRGFYQDMAYRFEEGSWVLPQIAVALLLLHPKESGALFREAMNPENRSKRFYQAACAERGLVLLGELPESQTMLAGKEAKSMEEYFVLEKQMKEEYGLTGLKVEQGLTALRVMREHWEFWKGKM
jgi:hypothetical protein